MTQKRLLTFVVTFILVTHGLSAQYRSIDFDINRSAFVDDYRDTEFDYDTFTDSGLVQWGLSGSFQLGDRFLISPRLAYAYGLLTFRKQQRLNTNASVADRTFVQKDQTINFLKTGVGFSFWAYGPGKGLYLEGEFQGVFSYAAKSEDATQVARDPIEFNEVDITEDVKSFVPSLKFGMGYSVPFKRFKVFVEFGMEFRVSTYFNTTNNFSFLNRYIGLGFGYVIRDWELQEP